ncbi:uncharacterized protein UV8b_01667 [Ustilaginoidea virens]|uniref:Uncharacterized protein n=1 Tax=Ustilaginoidea virens TaxID=1159556 RepID=A0A063BW08_USTVR|nr:uncharacterized protein UV8b_01667 [Ustilaginoidea virens]QUC17426.1 hypothetical protein UV8b_01667 [Ustilaginoidea virens]GAO13700.1 hypothetical protein UVI_02018020 [Ustilaginoidea virens]
MYTLSNVAQHRLAGPDDVYVLAVDQTAAGLAALSSDQQLTLFSPARLSDGPLHQWPTQHGNVTALRVFEADTSLVCTAGEDGTARVWDLRQAAWQGACVAQLAGAPSPILAMACDPSTRTVALGTELRNHTASLLLWDVRAAPRPRAHYQDLHSDDVTELAFHPSQPAVLLSGSTDGLVNVYDTRVADEDELTVQTFNHDASIHRAGFLSPTELLALSHDEQFAVYDMAEGRGGGGDVAALRLGDLRTALACQYVADAKAKTDGSGAVIGAGAQDRQHFELVFLAANEGRGPRWVLDRGSSVGLPGGHGGELVRSFCLVDDAQLVFTGGEDGSVKAWRPGH